MVKYKCVCGYITKRKSNYDMHVKRELNRLPPSSRSDLLKQREKDLSNRLEKANKRIKKLSTQNRLLRAKKAPVIPISQAKINQVILDEFSPLAFDKRGYSIKYTDCNDYFTSALMVDIVMALYKAKVIVPNKNVILVNLQHNKYKYCMETIDGEIYYSTGRSGHLIRLFEEQTHICMLWDHRYNKLRSKNLATSRQTLATANDWQTIPVNVSGNTVLNQASVLTGLFRRITNFRYYTEQYSLFSKAFTQVLESEFV